MKNKTKGKPVESKIIKNCRFSYETRSWVWVGHPLEAPTHPASDEERRIVSQSKFLRFREAVIHGRTHEVVEIIEEPLEAHLSTLEVSEGLFFAGRFFRDFYKKTH